MFTTKPSVLSINKRTAGQISEHRLNIHLIRLLKCLALETGILKRDCKNHNKIIEITSLQNHGCVLFAYDSVANLNFCNW
jgi:hypothetical protein